MKNRRPRNEIWIENRTPGRRSWRGARSGSKIGRLEGVVAEKLDLDGK